MWIGGIKVPKLINWLQRKFYDSSPDFVANTYRTSEDALGHLGPVKVRGCYILLLCFTQSASTSSFALAFARSFKSIFKGLINPAKYQV